MHVDELPTPSLVVDLATLDENLRLMGTRWPGPTLRTHVKAFKSTAMAAHVAAAGHRRFCCATPREVLGMAAAGLGDDLLLANESLDADRLRAMAEAVERGEAAVTVAVDSASTIDAAANAGLRQVLIDVNVGLPRCGCEPDDAPRLAQRARDRGLEVLGVMGYEGHVVPVDDVADRAAATAESMAVLAATHAEVGGDIVSGGATATWAVNATVTELQAGSFTLMDTTYAKQVDLPFRRALAVVATVVSVNARQGFAVADVGLKSLGMDHGNPRIEDHRVWVCSDEHVTYAPREGTALPNVGDRVRVWPAHVDPTVALHEQMAVVDADGDVVERWPVDLRGW